MILAIYDLSGIQNFIFATNKLTDIVGGSILVNQALFKNVPELLGEEENSWIENEFTFEPGDKAKTVYIGGGNALVMFPDTNICAEFTKKLKIRIFEQTRGALRLCHASIELELNKSLSDNQKLLMDKLDENKRNTPTVNTARGFSINAHDNTTFEPVLLFEEGYSPAGVYQKSKAYKDRGKEIFKELAPNGASFTVQFDKHKKKNAKNYLAVVHIDGNTMGQAIRGFVQAQKSGPIESLNALKKLSAEINRVYHDALKEAICETFKSARGEIPFRPIITDGDDITFICKSEDAFGVTEKFIRCIEKEKAEIAEDLKFTAGAGIAFVKTGFPFSTAYNIAEQCCKNAKEKTIERDERGKSSVDFHICYSGITTDVSEYRKRFFELPFAEQKYALTLRPYIFGAQRERYDYHKGFLEVGERIIKPGTVARSKLKGLRNAYGEGVLEAKTYGDFIYARAEKKEEKQVAEHLATPFDEHATAKFFDVLDIMDLHTGFSAAKEDKDKGENTEPLNADTQQSAPSVTEKTGGERP